MDHVPCFYSCAIRLLRTGTGSGAKKGFVSGVLPPCLHDCRFVIVHPRFPVFTCRLSAVCANSLPLNDALGSLILVATLTARVSRNPAQFVIRVVRVALVRSARIAQLGPVANALVAM